MKTRLLTAVVALIGAGCILATSCVPTEKLTPAFPELKIEKTLSAGESTAIEFDANMDWTLKVEGDGAGNYFGILDEGIMEVSVSGKAGHQSVLVGFSADEDFDVDRICTVILTMGGESKEIALLTKMRGNRKLDIYVALIDDYGYKTSGDGYVYGDVSAKSLKFSPFVGKADYTLPIKVVSNFKWLLNTNSQFVNASVTEANADGEETEVLLSLTTDESIADGTAVDIKFLASEDEDAVSYPYQLAIPAFGERMEIDCASTLYYNAEGQLKMPAGSFADQPGICYVLGSKGSVIRALDWNNDNGYYELAFASWVKASISFDDEKGYLQKVPGEITVEANTGAERYADILILPAKYANLTAEALCNEQGTDILDDYKQYLVTRENEDGELAPVRLVQEGKSVDPGEGTTDFVVLDPDYDNYKATLTKLEDHWLSDKTDQIFKLVYSGKDAESRLKFAAEVDRYEIYDYDEQLVSAEDENSFWLSCSLYGNPKISGNVTMDPDLFSNQDATAIESFIYIYDSSNNLLCILDCYYDESSSGEEGDLFTITNGSGTVEKLASDGVYEELYEGICSGFTVSEVYDITVSSTATIIQSAVAVGGANLYTMELQKLSDKSLELEGATANSFYLYVGETVTEKTSWVVVLKDANSVNFGAFIFTYDPTAAASDLINFVYPDLVQNASITKYTGSLVSDIIGAHYGISEDAIYELKYTGEPMNASISVPGEPMGEASWNNWDDATGGPYADYWLTYEMEGSNQMYVNMSEAGQSDWFVWVDTMGKYIAALVCTAEIK
ncbi:MAG: hypothetical protein ACI39U_06660 [Candidatus Cryptobacteroides sp.]